MTPGTSEVDEGQARLLLELFLRLVLARRRDRVLLRRPDADGPPPAHLTPRHLTAVTQLFLHGPLNVGQLAERLEVTVATASTVVRDIERAGLAQRDRDPADRRRVVVRLHPRVGEGAMRLRIAPMQRTLGRLNDEERTAFLKGMEFLVEELQTR